jgi:phage shock protein A
MGDKRKMKHTPEEIKNRLSNIGEAIGNIALNYIADLEKACDETQKLLDNQIEATYKLDKENAELKLKLEALEGQTPWKDIKDKSEVTGQLTKAKEHIKQLLDCLKQDTNDPQTNYYVCKYTTEAERFLKEVEK